MRLIILASRMFSAMAALPGACHSGLVPRKAAFSFFCVNPTTPFTFHVADYPYGTLKED